jgi:nucleoid-associated protein YgaU
MWLLLAALLLAGCPDDTQTRVHGTMAPGPPEMADDEYSAGYDDEPVATDSDYGYNDDYGESYNDSYEESYDDYGLDDQPTTVSGTATPIHVDPAPAPTYTPAPQPTYTPAPAPQPTGRRTYVIQRSDTLWGISKRFLGAGNRWREILAVNPGLQPRRLRIGQEIVIPPR